MDRRTFLKTTGAAASVTLLPEAAEARTQTSSTPSPHAFPKGFLWGTGTSSFQVEGAVREEGRGPSIWDTFSHQPGRIFNGETADVADDHFHRYKEDVALMKRLGVQTYRFSIAWPRVFPQGIGAPNPRGLDFYHRLLDELQAANITPYVTLFHWDLPQALQDRGGWQNRDTAKAFADYAAYTAGHLSDRITHWITTNEMHSFIDLGHGENPNFAPGAHINRAALAQARHHAVLAHGMGVQAIRASAKHPVKVGIAEDTAGFTPAIEDDQHIAAAAKAIREENAAFTTVVLEGRYTDHYLRTLGSDAPHFTPDDLRIISAPLDFFGVNIYTATEVVPATNELGYSRVQRPASYPHMSSPWLYLNPQAAYWTPRLLNSVWGVKEIYITENGASCEDVFTPEGAVLDTDRVLYLRNYFTQMQRAASDGVPLRGYFLWSMLDNFEWASGYGKRFGIVYVDFKTQKRTPKFSYEWYRSVIARNGLA